MSQGKLQIIATPIGNLEDVSKRAARALQSSDVILCEDTRVTSVLLKHLKISKPLISYHQHSEAKKTHQILELLDSGKILSLVTDAGTPGISDPGNILIEKIIKHDSNALIVPIPGPSALTAALSVSGFPTDKFYFAGFPPHKNKRQKFFKDIGLIRQTVVFYESGHRIKKCLSELKDFFQPDKKIIVCRELTKIFETVYRGSIQTISDRVKEERGEFVVIINNN